MRIAVIDARLPTGEPSTPSSLAGRRETPGNRGASPPPQLFFASSPRNFLLLDERGCL